MIMQKCLLPKPLTGLFLFTSFANYPLCFMSTTAKKNKTFGSFFPSCPRQFWISRHLSNLSATSLPGFSVEGERKRENPGREVGLSGELVLSRSVPNLLNHSDKARTALGKRLYRRFYSDKRFYSSLSFILSKRSKC